MRVAFIIFLLMLSSKSAWCDLRLITPKVYNGEIAVLQWQGESLSFGVARFMDHVVYLYPHAAGAIALLPVDLDVDPGHYDISTALVDKQGETRAQKLELLVNLKERPVEHLSLPEKMVTPSEKDMARIAKESKLLGEVFALRTNRSWTTFDEPVDEPISSVFGKRRIMNGKPRSPHSGTDFRSPKGTPIRSISNGKVVMVAELFYTGKTVVVDHGEGLFSLYAHLSRVLVEEGHELLIGDILGKVGSTGRSTGAHLHLSVKLLGERVDPEALLQLFKE